MTFHLTEDELQNGFDAIEHHGYSALLPTPPEWAVLKDNWQELKSQAANLDLDTYSPTQPLRVYAPKNRATVRVVSLLHPIDLILYTSLTLIVKNDLEEMRLQAANKKVSYSYHAEKTTPNILYGREPSFLSFREKLEKKSKKASVKFVASADIADFYPRIYQHRLENAVESAANSQRGREVARVLVRKLIGNLSGNNSYGIPVGPYASRLLAEAALADVDAYLISEGLDFIRWVDDFYFFGKTEQDCQTILIRLAQRLYETHGLTLSSSKTRILSARRFRERFDDDPDRVLDRRMETLREIAERVDPYDDEVPELTDEDLGKLAGVGAAEIIQEAVAEGELADYDRIAAVLRHPEVLSELPIEARKELADVLIDNIEHLYPVAAEVARFFSQFQDYNWKDRKRARVKLLASLRPKKGKWPPEYYMMWILSIFSESDAWRDSNEYVKIFRDHTSDLIRRMAALVIFKNGTRADALETKGRYDAASPLEQLAILMATRRLGVDERRHWRASLQLTGMLERKI